MDIKAFWRRKIGDYAKNKWAGKPSLFLLETKKYFNPKGRILVLGCATGDDGVWLAEQGYDVVQTDIIDDFFASIMERAKGAKGSLQHKIVDARDLSGFADASFDVVLAVQCLHYFDIKTTLHIMQEIKRLLKPNGIFSGLFNSTADSELGTGTKIEENFYLIDGIEKRFVDVATAQQLSLDMIPVLIDNKGSTYKDRAIGNNNLIRMVVKKEAA